MIYTKRTKKAMKLIYDAHGGQVDKAGVPYVYHPFHVAEQMRDEDSTLVALLHDLIEDTDVSIDFLREEFSAEVCNAVELLTRKSGEDYFDYIRRVGKNSLARRVKLADLEHNSDLTRIGGETDDGSKERVEKYRTAKKILLGMASEEYSAGRGGVVKTHAHPIKHFRTITRHRHKVIIHCFKVGIGFQGLFHDLSKYSPTEFIEGAKNFVGTYSPNSHAREINGYSEAWLHHKGRNKHHFEYWRDIDMATRKYGPIKMPVRYVMEMFCDRVAACKIYQGKNYTDRSALDYYKNGGAREKMHPETADLLEYWMIMLSERGESETFDYIKKYYAESKRKKSKKS